MTRKSVESNGASTEKQGRRNGGFSPFQIGYTGPPDAPILPKAPEGGTGQTVLVSNGSNPSAPKKQQG